MIKVGAALPHEEHRPNARQMIPGHTICPGIRLHQVRPAFVMALAGRERYPETGQLKAHAHKRLTTKWMEWRDL
jgi:hypothetical protein